MRRQRLCGRCGNPVGREYIEVMGIRVHLSCLHEAAEKTREEKTAREQAQMQETAVEPSTKVTP
jgi:hypothetical protein